MTTAIHECKECGNRTTAATRGGAKLFCSPICRMAFNNRRRDRGAEMYDLFRALRRERSQAKQLNIWTELCRLEKQWNDEDEAERNGRKAYMPPAEVLEHLRNKGSLPRGEILVKGR